MSTSIIKLHVFSGIYEKEPPCYLLKIDNFHCLLDCGWDSNFSDNYVDEVAKYSKIINAIFLTHSDVRHIGALAYLVGKCGLNCPIYATFPVIRMGHLSLYDTVLNKTADGLPLKFSLDDIDDTFEKIIPLKYQQTKILHGKGTGISVTPYLSGHTLGGSMWRICKDDTDILYTIDFNHKKELHLNGATFDLFPRPQLLILGCYTGVEKQNMQKSEREDGIKDMILSTLRKEGSILFLSDTAGRCLELAYLLENLWHNQQSGLMAYGLVFFNMLGGNIIESCQSFVEWMSEKVMQSFEELRTKPFEFRYTRVCHTLADLNEIPDPKVIIASQGHLNYGLTQELMLDLRDDPRNLIVMTERPREKCVASQIFCKLDKNMRSKAPIPLKIPDYKLTESTEFIENSVYNIVDEIQDQRAVLNIGADFNDDSMSSSSESISSNSDNDDDTKQGLLSSRDKDNRIQPRKRCVKRRLSQNGDSGSSKKRNRDNCSLKHDDNSGQETRVIKKESVSTVDSGSNSEVRGVHLSGFDLIHHHHHHGINANNVGGGTRKQMTFPQSRHKVFWDGYGMPINANDPNYLNTFGSSYAMNLLNNELLLQGNRNPLSSVNSDARIFLSQQSINKISDKINKLVSINGSTKGKKEEASISQDKSISNIDDSSGGGESLTNENQVVSNVPVKNVMLKCGVLYLDFEGIADNQALRQVISRLKPQELVLISRDSTYDYENSLVPFCTNSSDNSKQSQIGGVDKDFLIAASAIHLPLNRNEPINLTKETHLFQARMSDALVSGLMFQRIGMYELAWVDAIMRSRGQDSKPQSKSVVDNEDDDEEEMPILEPPINSNNNNELVSLIAPAHDTLYINEPKLSDLKQMLLAKGYHAEFMGGMLIVDRCVAVKRSETGKFTLEGMLCSTYFDVRQILYRQFAIL